MLDPHFKAMLDAQAAAAAGQEPPPVEAIHDTFLRAGYRMLHIDYEDGGFEWDVTYKGPMVGLTMRF